MPPRDALLVTLAAVGAIAWIAFLAIGRAPGMVKRLAWRATLLALSFGLVWSGFRSGLFARASTGFRLALMAAVLLVAIGNLYGVRFCSRCGRMHRNLRPHLCARCGFQLPEHGLTDRPKRAPPPPIRVTPKLPQRRSPK